MFTNEGARPIAMRHVFNTQKNRKVFLVPFFTTKEASGATLESIILFKLLLSIFHLC